MTDLSEIDQGSIPAAPTGKTNHLSGWSFFRQAASTGAAFRMSLRTSQISKNLNFGVYSLLGRFFSPPQ